MWKVISISMFCADLRVGKHVLGNANALDDLLGKTGRQNRQEASDGYFVGRSWGGNYIIWPE